MKDVSSINVRGGSVPNAPLALVTGANKGIGQETARQLAQRGITVMLGSRNLERGEMAAQELQNEGLTVIPVQIDVTDVTSVKNLATQLQRDYGRLDILINNAGILVAQPALSVTATHMRQAFETNVFGTVTIINTMLPLLRESEAPRIVNISSTSASLTLTSQPDSVYANTGYTITYSSSKTALNMLTVQYANAFKHDETFPNMKINAVTPGYVATSMNNYSAQRTTKEGVPIIIELATLPNDGPSGGFFNDKGHLPW